ncbi:MAG: ATP-binding protein [Burkholderiaceae bacterium]|nr:ATP-binding protein [Burkholderiaceae bacterium]
MRSLPLDRKVLLGFGFAVLVVLLVGAFSYLTTVRFVGSAREALLNAELVTPLKRVLAFTYETEAAQRSFLYTGERSNLAQRDAAIESTRRTLDELRRLARNDPALLARIDRLVPIVEARLRMLDEVLAARERSDAESRTLVARGLGREEMAILAHEVNAIADEQHAQLRANAEAARSQGNRIYSIFFVALAGVVALLLFLQHAIRREIASRQAAHAELAASEAKQAQLLRELQAANEELANFAYIASHDLKAPLRAIASLAQWISTDYADRFDDAGREQIALLLGRVKRMDRLIDGILQYSRVGRVREARTVVDLNEIVAETVDLLAPPAHVHVKVGRLPTLTIERTRAQQLFQNLIGNAIQYSDKPQGEVSVDCRRVAGEWQFTVRDNGPGIESRHFDRIFQMFQSLAPRDHRESTGIGLSLVKKIVETHGGRIWVESKIGSGSVFHFTLPLSATVASSEEQGLAPDEQLDPSGRGRRRGRDDRAPRVPRIEGHQSADPAC